MAKETAMTTYDDDDDDDKSVMKDGVHGLSHCPYFHHLPNDLRERAMPIILFFSHFLAY